MSQELFQKALAAKLAGDEDGFKQAVREAIVAKTKALLGEQVAVLQENKGPGVEEVDTNWFLVDQPFELPEGNVAGLPAGTYTATINATGISHAGALEIDSVEVHPADADSILITLHGDTAEQFFGGYVPQAAREWVAEVVGYNQDDAAEAGEHRRQEQEDAAADRSWDRQTNMDGKDYPF